MALTFDRLKALMDGERFRYFVDPANPVLMSGGTGIHGRYQFYVSFDEKAQFVQLRTAQYLVCPPSSPHVNSTLRLLLDLDYQLRFVKFAWDASDGEIVVYGDVWVADGTLTQGQFNRCLGNFLTAIDANFPRLSRVVSTGQDAGPDDGGAVPPGGGGNLTDKLRELIAGLSQRRGGSKATEPDDDVSSI